MPTDTQRAPSEEELEAVDSGIAGARTSSTSGGVTAMSEHMPDLSQCIEREREAANYYGAGCECDKCRAARAATDEAVRKVEELARAVLEAEPIDVIGFSDGVWLDDEAWARLRLLASKVTTPTGGDE